MEKRDIVSVRLIILRHSIYFQKSIYFIYFLSKNKQIIKILFIKTISSRKEKDQDTEIEQLSS